MSRVDATPDGWTFDDWCDEVWERNLPEPVSGLAGDRAVHLAAGLHGRACNGGVLHAVEVSVEDGTFDDDVAAFRWLGLGDAADALVEVRQRWSPDLGDREADALEEWADDRAEAVYDEALVIDAVAKSVERDPAAFAAPEVSDVASVADDADDVGGAEGLFGAVRGWWSARRRG